MGRRILVLCALALAACAPPAEDGEAGMDTAAAAATTALDEMAGTWTMHTMGETSDSVLTTASLSGSSDPSSWTLTLPDRAPIPLQVVEVSGDSVVMESGSFESVLRPGTTVTSVRMVSRLQNGELMGTLVARYAVTTADSIFRGRLHGVRAQ